VIAILSGDDARGKYLELPLRKRRLVLAGGLLCLGLAEFDPVLGCLGVRLGLSNSAKVGDVGHG
jgi:hypothetical protein